MEKHRKKKILWIPVGLFLAILVVLGICNRQAIHMVARNLFAEHIEMDEGDEWEGGNSYVRLPYAEDSDAQYVDLYVPTVPQGEELPGLFVLVHGGGFITNDAQSRQAQLMYRYFRDQGFACASVNYRLAQEAAFPAALCDVKAAVRFLRQNGKKYGYNGEQIAIWGESAGGYLAVAAAVSNDQEFMDVNYIGQNEEFVSAQVQVCVDYYGAVELASKEKDWETLKVPDWIIGVANRWLHTDVLEGYPDVESFWLRRNTGDMTAKEAAYSDIYTYARENLNPDSDICFWIAHGDCDITVPILQSQRFYDLVIGLMGEDAAEFHIIENAGHAGDIMYSEEELEKIRDYIREKFAEE